MAVRTVGVRPDSNVAYGGLALRGRERGLALDLSRWCGAGQGLFEIDFGRRLRHNTG